MTSNGRGGEAGATRGGSGQEDRVFPQSQAGRASEGSDDAAVARARAGDHEAFRVLVERHQGRLFRLAARVLRDDDLARDAVQDAFLKAYTSLRRFEGRSSFYTWIYRLTLNVCLDMRRRNRSDRNVEWPESGGENGGAGLEPTPAAGTEPLPSGPDAEAERGEIRQRVSQAIDDLPQEARETLLLREVDGLSYAEISETLGIPKGTVMSRLHYARKRVQKLLVSAGIGASGALVEDASGEQGDES